MHTCSARLRGGRGLGRRVRSLVVLAVLFRQCVVASIDTTALSGASKAQKPCVMKGCWWRLTCLPRFSTQQLLLARSAGTKKVLAIISASRCFFVLVFLLTFDMSAACSFVLPRGGRNTSCARKASGSMLEPRWAGSLDHGRALSDARIQCPELRKSQSHFRTLVCNLRWIDLLPGIEGGRG